MSASHHSPRSKAQSFSAEPFDIPHSRVSGSLLSLSAGALLLSGGAFFLQQNLIGRQMAGTERVLLSLDAESKELDASWAEGAIPAKMLTAENQHIDEEKEQQRSQLAQLKKSSDHG